MKVGHERLSSRGRRVVDCTVDALVERGQHRRRRPEASVVCLQQSGVSVALLLPLRRSLLSEDGREDEQAERRATTVVVTGSSRFDEQRLQVDGTGQQHPLGQGSYGVRYVNRSGVWLVWCGRCGAGGTSRTVGG